MAASSDVVSEPFPIFRVAGNYILYDINVVSHIRRQYNICGVLLGSLPQIPQQSVFLGLPLQLLPEEARLLAEQGHAYIVDDAREHKAAMLEAGLSEDEKAAFRTLLGRQSMEAAEAVRRKAGERKEKALKKIAMQRRKHKEGSVETDASGSTLEGDDVESSLFSNASQTEDTASTISVASAQPPNSFAVTPTTSYPPLPQPDLSPAVLLPEVPSSYPLFKHLQQKGYFMMPGLRFGCQYSIYPGDPLRFHSHFLAVGRGWDDDIRMMEIVGGGRLGTGVKKAFMIGGNTECKDGEEVGDQSEVRAFCFEWAGM
ncbi:tRNA-intron endonuclease [Rhizodiscina lignyota]|uniref:tRNA-splicing endonuclease subunit Sen34 n=1 Tax=Rhizodiscina lignyota TaxID=1504668 RepID=A0A9P4IRH6_9PEZI|nr:tRNA-intron endonuclease [Rhizodiscina lignyota]